MWIFLRVFMFVSIFNLWIWISPPDVDFPTCGWIFLTTSVADFLTCGCGFPFHLWVWISPPDVDYPACRCGFYILMWIPIFNLSSESVAAQPVKDIQKQSHGEVGENTHQHMGKYTCTMAKSFKAGSLGLFIVHVYFRIC